MNKPSHWFVSPTGHLFYVSKIMSNWRFIGRDTFIIKENPNFKGLKKYVINTFGFEYLGYM